MPRGEVVRAIKDDVSAFYEWLYRFPVQTLRERDKFNFRIQSKQRCARGLDFRRADRISAVEDLALQVGKVDLVGIGEGQLADAACCEVEGGRTTQAARADDERARRAQAFLAFNADLRQQDVPAVAEELLVVQC